MSLNHHRASELDVLREQQQRDKKLIREIIESFAKVIDMKDSYTQGHSLRLANRGELKAPDDVGGGTFDDISNIREKQE